ncbi:MAG: bifunctional nuclease family protein [bacterium]|nr:bifunctional nuclease family protein [bacterium]
MKEVTIDSIMFDLIAKTPVVILKEVNGDRYLPILIGPYEANAIDMGLKNIPYPRPMTHDLLYHILEKLDRVVEYIHITHIEDSTFYSNIVIYDEGEKIVIDARPSDAIALALRTKSPVMVNEEILIQAGIPLKALKPENRPDSTDRFNKGPDAPFREGKGVDDTTQFREFLKDIKPEDFFKDIDELDDDIDDEGNSDGSTS